MRAFRVATAARGGGVQCVAFSPSFGEAGMNATLEYYLASAFDKVQAHTDTHTRTHTHTHTHTPELP